MILGSCRFEPYEVLAMPNRILGVTNDETGYEKACKIFYPAIDQADLILVYAPDGVGEHTGRDIEYAEKCGKKIVMI